MTSATDLITYIGVPLTVAGVLPLLWNMILAIRIWLKLRSSIPLQFRKYYSLIPDPAAGKVTVVARTPSLELPGLWSTNKTGGEYLEKALPLKPSTTLPNLAEHVAFVPIAPAVSAFAASRLLASDDSIAMSFRSFNVPRQGLLGRTWMTLTNHCGLILGSPQDDENVHGTDLEREEEDEVRFPVESDMNASALTPLRMNWAQFVWLSLALGVRPYDSAWNGSYPCTLKDTRGNAFITLFESDGQLFARLYTEREVSYSLNRAFAWQNVILEKEGLWPLGQQHKPHVPLSSVQISPGLSNLFSPEDLENDTKSVLRGKEAQDCEDPLASACCWMLYHRRHRSITGDSIPVSQQMMEFRERTLCHLLLMDKKGQLEDMIQLLVSTPPESKDLVAIGGEKLVKNEFQREMGSQITRAHGGHMHVGETPVCDQANAIVGSVGSSQISQRIPVGVEQSELDSQAIDRQSIEKQELTPCDFSQFQANHLTSATHGEPAGCNNPDDAHADEDGADGRDLNSRPPTATKPQFDHWITSSRTGPIADGSHLTRVNTQNGKTTTQSATQLSASQSKTASTILDAIRSAMTTSNYVKRFEMLSSIQSQFLHAFDNLSERGPRNLSLLRFQQTKEIAKRDSTSGPVLTQFDKFSIECSKLDSLRDHNNRRSNVDIYELLPHNHRLRLEDAALAGMSPSSVLRFDAFDDTSFTAIVALATADWDTVIHQAWRLNMDAMGRYDALTTKWLDRVLQFRFYQEERLESQRELRLDIELEATALINDGLYKAPESSELDTLLTKEVRKVCLL